MDNAGPSITARRVAAHRLGFTRVPVPYGDPAADDALAADVAADQESPAGPLPHPPPLTRYLAARTTFFDRVVVTAIDRGVRQVVVGAAGYDGRAFRYAKPGVRWFEVDHPATQRDKRDRLNRLGVDAHDVRFVAADFAEDPVAGPLLEAGLNGAERSLFLLEGLAVYLELPVLETVLSQLRHVTPAGSRLAMSVSTSGADGEARSRFRAFVAALGEPARSTLDADQAGELLARTGWQLTTAADPPDDHQAAARRERQRTAGLLTARAGPKTRGMPIPQPTARPSRRQAPGGRATVVAPSPRLPLPALLSHALVAYTIEFDNEAEHRTPHRTTSYGPSSHGDGLWLVSLVMWENCMRFVGDEPITVGELEQLARTGTNLDGMRRWGYVTIDGTAQRVHQARPGPGAVLRATASGLRARQVWLPLASLIEQRWRERFGADEMSGLRGSLAAVVGQLDPGLPDCLPIIAQDLRTRWPGPGLRPRTESVDAARLPLSALLARALLSFALEYERESELSLAASANLLRVLGEEGTRLRDLPLLAGISKEAASWALGVLIRARLAVEEPDPSASRGKIASLTSAGITAQRSYVELLGAIEERWPQRFGDGTISSLRRALEALTTGSDDQPPPLFRGLEPYPDNWRARVRAPATLPRYPMVLHRGGYPDGS